MLAIDTFSQNVLFHDHYGHNSPLFQERQIYQLSSQNHVHVCKSSANLVMFTVGGADAEALAIESKPFNSQTLREQGRGAKANLIHVEQHNAEGFYDDREPVSTL